LNLRYSYFLIDSNKGKVTEPFSPIPGRVPRKVAIDRKKKEYASFNIEAELAKLVFDLLFY